MTPRSAPSAASTAAARRGPAHRSGVSSPSRSSVVERGSEHHHGAVGLLVARGGTRPCAWRAPGTRAGRPPRTGRACRRGRHAGHRTAGARWPPRHGTWARWACPRRGCRPGHRAWLRSAISVAGHSVRHRAMSRVASPRTAARAGPMGSSTVAPAARACPPPPNARGEHDGVHAAFAGPGADPGPVAQVPEQDGHLGGARLGQQVDDALGQLEHRTRSRARSAGSSVAQTSRPSARGLQPRQHDAEQLQLGVGLGAVEQPRDVRERRSGGHAARSPLAASAAWRWGAGTWRCRRRCPPSGRPRWRRPRHRTARPGAAAAGRPSRRWRPPSGSIQSTAPKPVLEA